MALADRNTMSNSNRGGARPGAGRPRIKVIKMPVRPDFKYIPVAISEQFWQEFCESAEETVTSICNDVGSPVSEAEYVRLAEMVMIDAMHRYIKNKRRKAKEQN